MAINRDKLKSAMALRVGMELAPLDPLIDWAVQDFCEFTHRDPEELTDAMSACICDLVAYRYTTLGVEGITSESQGGVATQYDSDIPDRIKTKMRTYRRLNYVRQPRS